MILHLAVDRGDDGGPGHRFGQGVEPAGDRQAVGRQLGGPLPRRARELGLVLGLEPGDALAVHVDEPQHLWRQRARRVVPLGHLEEPDPGELLGFEFVGDVHVDLALEVDEGPVGLERLLDVLLLHGRGCPRSWRPRPRGPSTRVGLT